MSLGQTDEFRTGDTFHFRSAMQVGGARPPANKLFTTLGARNSSTHEYHGAYCPLLRCPSMPQCGSLDFAKLPASREDAGDGSPFTGAPPRGVLGAAAAALQKE